MMIDTINLVRQIKKILPQTKIILGGPHINIYPQETLAIKEVDFLILGEGEQPCLDLINNINDQTKLKDVTGLAFMTGENYINTGARPLLQNLDELPFPAREITDYKRYYSTLSHTNPTTSMFTSRGCPYQCVFCDRPHRGKFFRARSAKNVVEEMLAIKKLGINEIFIYDDTFTIDRQRVIDVCREIIRLNLKINWDIRARVNTVDEELLLLMKKAGCVRIHYGVESGVDQILINLRKGITVEMVKKAFKLTHKIGIETAGYFMLGCPGEKIDDIKATIKLAKKLKPAYAHFSVLTPFPATDIYFIGLKNGLIKKDVWREFALNPKEDFVPPVWEENFSKDELIKLLKKAYFSFYFRPSVIWHQFLKLKSWSDFSKKFKIALGFLKMKLFK